MVCNGTCSVPQGATSSKVAIVQNSECEISIGVTNTLEGYVYRNFPPRWRRAKGMLEFNTARHRAMCIQSGQRSLVERVCHSRPLDRSLAHDGSQ